MTITTTLLTYCRHVIKVQQSRATLKMQVENSPVATPVVYHSLQSVLNILNDSRFKDSSAVKALLEIYENVRTKNKINPGEQKRYPLIVMEGLDGSGKTTTTRALAKKVGAEILCTPPACLQQIRNLFDDDALLRTAYYAVGNYVAALEISTKLKEKPVVLDRFWHSTAAYAIAQVIKDNPSSGKLPPAGDEFYCWPKDLLKPDIILLLSVSEAERLRRHSRRRIVTPQEQLLKSDSEFRENVLTAYKNMRNPSIEIINADPPMKVVVNQLLETVKPLLQ